MKKDTLIRSDRAHTVKMQEGSDVAQRKTVKKDSLVNPPDTPLPSNFQKIPTTETVPSSKSKAKAPASKTRSKALASAPEADSPVRTAKPKPKAPSRGKVPAAKPIKTQAAATIPTPAPAQTSKSKSGRAVPVPAPMNNVWEANNPIQQRLALLRTRNAEIEEQIQRLQQSMPARGKRP